MGDSGYYCATVLFKESDKEIEIFWQDDNGDFSGSTSAEDQKRCETISAHRMPNGITLSSGSDTDGKITKKASYWKTKEGVHVGISLFELEKINGAPVDFESSASCFDGGILSWNGGKLEKQKDLFNYSRISYPFDGLERIKEPDSAAISSKNLTEAMKKKVFLGVIMFSLQSTEAENGN